MLESLPGVGKVKARRIMEEIGISETRRVAGLGAQQREALLDPKLQAATTAPDLIIVISGPGGVGKGTSSQRSCERDPASVAQPLVDDPRARRPGEAADAYVFVDRDAFEARIDAGGFLEWTEFLGNYYGTPDPGGRREAPTSCSRSRSTAPSRSSALHPDAVLIFVLPPSREEQERRLRSAATPRTRSRSGCARPRRRSRSDSPSPTTWS